jgi:hypothetical protein
MTGTEPEYRIEWGHNLIIILTYKYTFIFFFNKHTNRWVDPDFVPGGKN